MKNFSQFAFTESVKKMQTDFGTREFNSIKENDQGPPELTQGAIDFISSCKSFYLSTVGENGWPYVQHKGGPAGFLKVINSETIAFADYSGNKQLISAGNISSSGKAVLFLMSYPTQQRMKLWVEIQIFKAAENPEWLKLLKDPDYTVNVERLIIMKVVGLDWNCNQHITPRFSIEELQQIFSEQPELKDQMFQ